MKFRLIALLLAGGLLASCGFGRMATGVVVWAPDASPVKNGDLVWIWEQSRIRHSFKIQPVNGSPAFETDQWRIKSFPGDTEAQNFAKAFLPLKDTWALAGKQGLPVRATPDANADRVYKLGEKEEVKVLSRNDNKVKQGNLEGTWVEVLTKDGYSGWVFDYYLDVVDKSKGAAQAIKPSGPGDENVQILLSNTWYPDEMKAMVDQDRLQPELFRPELGLRLASADAKGNQAKAFLLTLPAATAGAPDDIYELPWDDPRKIDASSYWFGGPEKLRVQFTSAEFNRISVGFTWKGQEKTILLSLLQDDVGTLLSRELASRQGKWAELKNHGDSLVSPTYGHITLGQDGAFTWEGFETLQPPSADILASAIPTQGTIAFDWFKDRKYVGEFRPIRFIFGTTPDAFSQVFLYRFLKDGFQLLPVSPRDTDQAKHTVLRESRTGLSLFFTFQK